jgi:hypothetical protein
MRMLPYPSVAEIDNSADDDTARLVQYVHWQRQNPGPPIYSRVYQSVVRSSQRHLCCASIARLETIQYTASGRPYKGPKQPAVKVNPCLRSTCRSEDDYLFLASDGIWRRSPARA